MLPCGVRKSSIDTGERGHRAARTRASLLEPDAKDTGAMFILSLLARGAVAGHPHFPNIRIFFCEGARLPVNCCKCLFARFARDPDRAWDVGRQQPAQHARHVAALASDVRHGSDLPGGSPGQRTEGEQAA